MRRLLIAALVLTLATPAIAYGGRHGHHHGHHGWGWGGQAIVGGIVIGGALAAAAISEDVAKLRACTRDFPGFDATTRTIPTADGRRITCPYLY